MCYARGGTTEGDSFLGQHDQVLYHFFVSSGMPGTQQHSRTLQSRVWPVCISQGWSLSLWPQRQEKLGHMSSPLSHNSPAKEGTTLTDGEIEAGEDGKHKQAPSQLFSAHFRSTLGGDLGSKASPQISHWTKFEGYSLTARARAEPTHALAELVLIMTLLSRVHFTHFAGRLNDFPRVTQLGNMECK